MRRLLFGAVTILLALVAGGDGVGGYCACPQGVTWAWDNGCECYQTGPSMIPARLRLSLHGQFARAAKHVDDLQRASVQSAQGSGDTAGFGSSSSSGRH